MIRDRRVPSGWQPRLVAHCDGCGKEGGEAFRGPALNKEGASDALRAWLEARGWTVEGHAGPAWCWSCSGERKGR